MTIKKRLSFKKQKWHLSRGQQLLLSLLGDVRQPLMQRLMRCSRSCGTAALPATCSQRGKITSATAYWAMSDDRVRHATPGLVHACPTAQSHVRSCSACAHSDADNALVTIPSQPTAGATCGGQLRGEGAAGQLCGLQLGAQALDVRRLCRCRAVQPVAGRRGAQHADPRPCELRNRSISTSAAVHRFLQQALLAVPAPLAPLETSECLAAIVEQCRAVPTLPDANAKEHCSSISTTPVCLAVLGRKEQCRIAAASRSCRSASHLAQRSTGGAASRCSLAPPPLPPLPLLLDGAGLCSFALPLPLPSLLCGAADVLLVEAAAAGTKVGRSGPALAPAAALLFMLVADVLCGAVTAAGGAVSGGAGRPCSLYGQESTSGIAI